MELIYLPLLFECKAHISNWINNWCIEPSPSSIIFQ